MIRFLFALAFIAFSQTAHAQADDWLLGQRDKDAIGIVEVSIRSTGLESDNAPVVERGTGSIISGVGHVLTAGHLLSPENFSICARMENADGGRQCSISFLWRGDRANQFDLTIVSERPNDRDYLVLRLPAASDKIGRPAWPHVTLARQALDGEAIYAAGYQGSDPAQRGAVNSIDTLRGSLRADAAASCANSYGIARVATAIASPGLSGGPTFNRLHRVIGIILGAACPGDGAGSIQDAPRSRILLVEDMPRLCGESGFPCFFGYDGDLDPATAIDPAPWYERLIGGESIADQFVYGWKLREVAKLSNYGLICLQMMSDTQLVESVQADAANGAQLAVVYAAIYDQCRLGSDPTDAARSKLAAERMAESGYEPAQYAAAEMIIAELTPKLAARRSPADPLLLSVSEREKIARAERYYRASAAHNWPASLWAMFNHCTARVFSCRPEEPGEFLEAAASEGQRDAVRSEAIARLIGDNGDELQRFGFARPKDTDRALALLQQAATPAPGASRNPSLTLYDNSAAGYLSYFYWGGLYQGQRIVATNPVSAQMYGQGCMGGASGLTAQLEFCGMIDAVGRFNSATDRATRISAWSYISQFIPWAITAGPLARNLATWSSDGSDIDHISCDLNPELRFSPPATPPDIRPHTAYCYFRKPA